MSYGLAGSRLGLTYGPIKALNCFGTRDCGVIVVFLQTLHVHSIYGFKDLNQNFELSLEKELQLEELRITE